MANKTKPTIIAPATYIETLDDAVKQADSLYLCDLMQRLTGAKAKMWGASIIGFGDYHYKYDSGREGDFFLAGFAPRKANLVVYLNGIITDQDALLAKLGKHKMGKGCLYIKRLQLIDKQVLEQLITASVGALRAKYPDTTTVASK